MPSLKLKKKTQEYLAEKERSKQPQKDQDSEKEAEPTPIKKKDQKPKKKDKPAGDVEVPIILEKRRRTVPPGEQKLMDWLSEHVESKEGACVSFQILFDYFTDFCAQEATPVTIDTAQFNRVVRDKFGKEVGIQESSPYKGLIKEVKPKPKSPKVKAESLNMKMKDIIEEVLKEIGNPTNGVQFRMIKTVTANKYPALQIDLLPNKLVSALDRGVYYGHIDLVKGTGKCGFYRLHGVEPSEEIKEKEEKEKEKERLKKEEEKQKKEEKLKKKKEKESEKENTEGGSSSEGEKPKKRGTKRKSQKLEKSDKSEDSGADGDEPQKKKKKKKPTPKKPKWEKGDSHSNPEKIDDTFPLAFTYCSEPKETSFRKIRQYLIDNYPSVNIESKLKQALEKGIENGVWEQSTGGSVSTGSFRLLLDDFDPESSKTIDDMICQAIVACHEPKSSTVIRIKQYIMDYHPDFSIESRPHKFKTALERALKNGVIRQLTGIGMSGTFQLVKSFTPSPRTLAGIDDDVEQFDDVELVSDEKYVIRKTKSGRFSGKKA